MALHCLHMAKDRRFRTNAASGLGILQIGIDNIEGARECDAQAGDLESKSDDLAGAARGQSIEDLARGPTCFSPAGLMY
jgi:hypothetical protein